MASFYAASPAYNATASFNETAFNETVQALIDGTTGTITTALNTYFVLAEGFLVFMMQLGFALLTVGCVTRKSALSICLKNLLDVSFGVLGFWLFGWAFAYGDHMGACTDPNDSSTCRSVQNPFIGSINFAMHDLPSSSFHTWFFQYVFAISTATIVSGAVAERITMLTYALYAFFLTAWVYPVIAHFVWSTSGWASTTRVTGPLFLGTGVYDTVGSGAVHMVGGVAAFMGAWISGPRLGRFDETGKPRPKPGHNNVFYLAGVLLLWFGFYGFNPGTMGQLIATDGSDFSHVVARCVISTTLGGGFGAVTACLLKLITSKIFTGHGVWDMQCTGNGALCGMIVITSGCATFEPWAAMLGGIIGGLAYQPGAWFILHILKVDDPVDATTVHGICGGLGVMWYSLMCEQGLVHDLYGATNPDGSDRAYGWWRGDGPTLVWANLTWILVIIGWTAFWMGGFFYLLKALRLLRVPYEDEVIGIDVSHHGGSAYVEDYATEGMGSGKPYVKGTGSASNDSQDLEREVEMLRAEMLSLTGRLNDIEAGRKTAQ